MNVATDASGDRTVDLSSLIDKGGWGGYQKLVLFLASLAIVLDGLDTQIIGFAAPAMTAELGITKAQLAPVIASGLIGMTIGAALGGRIGDQFGRKAAVIGSVVIFGTLTGLMALATDVTILTLLRFLAGLGLGGALPNVSALVAEITPARHRSVAVAASIVCIPVGGVLGGFISAFVLPSMGWRGLFVVAGVLPLILGLLLLVFLPESVRFMARYSEKREKVVHLLRRMGLHVQDDATFISPTAPAAPKGSYGMLLSSEYRRDTLALWLAFFFCLFSVYMVFNWLPSLMADQGFDLAATSSGLAAFNVGGVIAALIGASLASRYGSKIPMLVMAGAAAVGAVLLALVQISPDDSYYILLIALGFEGAFIAGLQTVLYALAAHVYPTATRATGVGASAGIGRLGAVLSTVVGAAVLAAAGNFGFYTIIAVAMVTCGVMIAVVTRHVPVSND